MTTLITQPNDAVPIPAIALDLTAVAVVLMDDEGRLIECNKGFRHLLYNRDLTTGYLLSPFFIQPQFHELSGIVAQPDEGLIYQGLFNIGEPNAAYRTLSGALYRRDQSMLLVAEHQIEDLERMSATVVDLNEELADTQRQLVRVNRDLKRRERQLEQIALTDTLTQLPNRRSLDQVLEREIARSTRERTFFSIALADIDHFKSINDQHGHDIGDTVLQIFAKVVEQTLRRDDFAARQGGEEFALVYPNTLKAQAVQITDRVRVAVASRLVPELGHAITASFGVTQWQPGNSAKNVFKRADQALYNAKESGRNRVVAQ